MHENVCRLDELALLADDKLKDIRPLCCILGGMIHADGVESL